jgi:hypothetical protein
VSRAAHQHQDSGVDNDLALGADLALDRDHLGRTPDPEPGQVRLDEQGQEPRVEPAVEQGPPVTQSPSWAVRVHMFRMK